MSLKNVPLKELQDELERRSKGAPAIPQPIENPDFAQLIKTCKEHLETIVEEGYIDDDGTEYIYEAAMTALYGDGIFTYINSIT